MARLVVPLTERKCSAAKPQERDYKLFDGGGLFLLVKKTGIKTWRLKFRKPDGKESVITFGNYPKISLKKAREYREQTKDVIASGLDPIQVRKDKATKNKTDTFKEIAISWYNQANKEKKWKQNHANTIMRSIEMYLLPHLGSKQVQTLTLKDLAKPIQQVTELGFLQVALRLRQITIAIMRHAVFKGILNTNPALDLVALTIRPLSVHRPALPLSQLGELVKSLENYSGQPIIKLTILLALHVFVRSSELRFARWCEIDLKKALWRIPASRKVISNIKNSERGAKMKTDHIVPLSPQAVNILKRIKELTGQYELVFTNNGKKPISSTTLNYVLRQQGYCTQKDICLHGFRTMACSALVESGLFSRDAIERQMSHRERSSVRAAYIHLAEHLNERRKMLVWWSSYIEKNKKRYIPPYDFNLKSSLS